MGAYKRISSMLETPALSAGMSPEELDALAIVQTQEGYAKMISKTSAGFENVAQKLFTHIGPAESNTARTPELSTQSTPERSSFQGLRDVAQDGLDKARQAAADRVQTAKAGKKFLDDGG